MAAFLLDEHMRGKLAAAIRKHNAAGDGVFLDIRVVGEESELPLGTLDPELIRWAEREGRLLLTFDKSTMPGHLADHLAAGAHTPGILCVRRRLSIPGLIIEFEIVAHAGRPEDFADTITYIP